MTVDHARRELDCDLLVVGGGAAGLAGAVTAAYHGLKVIVAEKAPVLGGATSWSGGWMWAPLNPLSQADGIVEDIEAPRTYLKHALGERLRRGAGRRAAAERPAHGGVLREAHGAAVRVRHVDRRHPGRPARRRHRRPIGRPEADQRAAAHEGAAPQAAPASSTRPRSWAWASWPARTCRPSCTRPPRSEAFVHAGVAGRVPRARPDHPPPRHAAGQRHRADRPAGEVGRRPRRAAVGELARRPGCSPRTGPCTGAVRGHARTARSPCAARRGVLLAAGGFPNDVDRRRELFPRTPDRRASTGRWRRRRPPATGSPSASRSAAGSTPSLASPAAWCPVSLVPYRNGRVGVYPHIVDRGKPGLIAVLSNGETVRQRGRRLLPVHDRR